MSAQGWLGTRDMRGVGGGVDDGAQEGKGVWAEFSCLHLQKHDDAS